MRALSLFSGYGGVDLALNDYVTPIAYVEIEEYVQKTIAYRMADGSLKRAPILADVKNVKGSIGDCEIIYGGFPCQDISTAGTGKGLAGERSGLFFEIVRLVSEIRPRFVFLENVAAITVRGLDRVTMELTALGYDCRWTIVSAAGVGANHRRERFFCLAHANNSGQRKSFQSISERERRGPANTRSDGEIQSLAYSDSLRKLSEQKTGELSFDGSSDSSSKMADAIGERLEIIGGGCRDEKKFTEAICTCEIQNSDGIRSQRPRCPKRWTTNPATDASWWSVEPDVGRVVDGTSFRVDRIKALGNGVVPLQARTAFKYLGGIK